MEVEEFRFSNSIMTSKVYCETDDIDQNYDVRFNNLSLSQHADCILHVNVLNMYYQQLTSRQSYDYLFYAIRPMKRKFVKWGKKANEKKIKVIQDFYGFSMAKAQEAAKILTDEQIKILEKELDTGG